MQRRLSRDSGQARFARHSLLKSLALRSRACKLDRANAMNPASRLQHAFALIDAANRADPETEAVDGALQPREWIYGVRMSAELNRYRPDAPEALQLAVRAQHIRRWEIPRSSYPMDRAGYHRWRTTLYKFHAGAAAEILRTAGYDAETIARVEHLIQKKRLREDPDTATLEDVVCMVFLRFYAERFAAAHPLEKTLGILQKTWAKMSSTGQAAALALDLPPAVRALVERALAETPAEGAQAGARPATDASDAPA